MVRLIRTFGWSIRSFRLFGRPIWSFWLFGRSCSFSLFLSVGRGGASRAFPPMLALGWSFLHLIFPAAGYLTAVSFLVVRPVFSPWGALVVVMGSRWPLLDVLPQLLVLTRRFLSKVLNAGCNNLHLSLDQGHWRISAGPLMMVVAFHCFSWLARGPFVSKNSRFHRWRQLMMSKISGSLPALQLNLLEDLQPQSTDQRRHRRGSGVDFSDDQVSNWRKEIRKFLVECKKKWIVRKNLVPLVLMGSFLL